MKKIIYNSIVLLIVILTACEKDNEKVTVSYRVSNAYAETTLSYRTAEAVIATEKIDFTSAEDIWQRSFKAERGDIVYISAVYQDSASSVRLEILVDGKVYKSGSSVNEPEKYVTVSGVVPY